MSPHATAGDLEKYVIGALPAARAESLEAHVASCDLCGAALAREATLEMAFEQVARRGGSMRSRAMRVLRAAGYGGAGLVAVAAGLLLWIGRGSAPVAGESASSSAVHAVMEDGAILDARNDALDGG